MVRVIIKCRLGGAKTELDEVRKKNKRILMDLDHEICDEKDESGPEVDNDDQRLDIPFPQQPVTISRIDNVRDIVTSMTEDIRKLQKKSEVDDLHEEEKKLCKIHISIDGNGIEMNFMASKDEIDVVNDAMKMIANKIGILR